MGHSGGVVLDKKPLWFRLADGSECLGDIFFFFFHRDNFENCLVLPSRIYFTFTYL